MNKPEPIKVENGLEKLREPFEARHIGKLPKPTKKQNECSAGERINCALCGGWHHPKVAHVDYVGHAALTDRLLDTDLMWNWEPLAYTEQGLPAFDKSGGLWIRLEIKGLKRIGYGNAAESKFKSVGDREKEVIGDALRNAAMRFGAALDLWHKGDLHEEPLSGALNRTELKSAIRLFVFEMWQTTTTAEFDAMAEKHKKPLKQARDEWEELLDTPPEVGFLSVDQQYNKKKEQLKSQEDIFAQLQKDLEPPK